MESKKMTKELIQITEKMDAHWQEIRKLVKKLETEQGNITNEPLWKKNLRKTKNINENLQKSLEFKRFWSNFDRFKIQGTIKKSDRKSDPLFNEVRFKLTNISSEAANRVRDNSQDDYHKLRKDFPRLFDISSYFKTRSFIAPYKNVSANGRKKDGYYVEIAKRHNPKVFDSDNNPIEFNSDIKKFLEDGQAVIADISVVKYDVLTSYSPKHIAVEEQKHINKALQNLLCLEYDKEIPSWEPEFDTITRQLLWRSRNSGVTFRPVTCLYFHSLQLVKPNSYERIL